MIITWRTTNMYAIFFLQNPAKADPMMKVQAELDETKIILVNSVFPNYIKVKISQLGCDRNTNDCTVQHMKMVLKVC